MEGYEGKTDIKNSSSTIDFGYYDVVMRSQEGGRIEAGKEYICIVERLSLSQLRLVFKEKDCKCQGQKEQAS